MRIKTISANKNYNRKKFNEMWLVTLFTILILINNTVFALDLNALPNPKELAITSGQGDISTNLNVMTVNQSSSRMVVEWNNFNVGSEARVNFVQPSPNSAVLNRVDTTGGLSEIYGKITANGQVYIINPNGILFGNGSSVDVGGLVASTLNISNDLFNRGFLTSSSDSAAFNSFTDINDSSVIINTGASLKAVGGKIMIFAPIIENAGLIQTPDGQTLLAAGRKVYLYASQDPSLRGLLVEVDNDSASNSHVTNLDLGQIIAERGNITLAGIAVNQNGRIKTTTSVNLNGSVRLQARTSSVDAHTESPSTGIDTHYADVSGDLVLGADSITEVLPDLQDKNTVLGNSLIQKSYVNITGKSIHINENALIIAPGGDVSLTAILNPNTPAASSGSALFNESRIYFESGSGIDVSGIGSGSSIPGRTSEKPAQLSVADNIVLAQLFSNELRDAPLQRDGILYRSKVYVDARAVGVNGNVGTSVADVSGYFSQIGQTVAERLAAGGLVNIQSEGDIIFSPNAWINVSGGKIDYTSGIVSRTRLISSSGLDYDIANAPKDLTYTGMLNVSSYEKGYSVGKNAGSILFSAPAMVLSGKLEGKIYIGEGRRLADIPHGASLQLGKSGLSTTNVLHSDIIFDGSGNDYSSVTFGSTLSSELRATLQLGKNFIPSGFSSLKFLTDGQITVKKDATITTQSKGVIALKGGGVDIHSTLTSHGGTIDISAYDKSGYIEVDVAKEDKRTGNVELFAGAKLDVSGIWINDILDTPINEAITIDGGKISVTSSVINKLNPATGNEAIGGDVKLNQGSLVNASGGAWLNYLGKITAGNGGGIILAASGGQGDTANRIGDLILNGELRADSLSAGGSLALTSGSVIIGSSLLSHVKGQLLLDPSFFHNGGFSSYSVTSYNELTVGEGATIAPLAYTRILDIAFSTQKSGNEISEFSHLMVLPASNSAITRKATNLSLIAKGLNYGNLRLEKNSSILTDPGATIILDGNRQLTALGTISNPGGRIELTQGRFSKPNEYQSNLTLWLGSQSILDVSGIDSSYIDRNGLIAGTVIDAGSIEINSSNTIVAESGAQIKLSGTHAVHDVKVGNGFTKKDIGSSGGSLSLSSSSILWDADMSAQGGSSAQASGSFELILPKIDKSELDLINAGLDPAVQFPTWPREIVMRATGTAIQSLLSPGSEINHALNGRAYIFADKIQAAGFDNVKLISPDNIGFSEQLSLKVRGILTLDAPNLIFTNNAKVDLSASLASIGYNQKVGVADVQEPVSISADVETNLTVDAYKINLFGTQSLLGLANANFISKSSVQLSGVLSEGNTKDDPSGSIKTGGNISIKAGIIFPTTLSKYIIKSTGTDGKVNFQHNGTDMEVPFSVLGNLEVVANTINQGGVLRAPFGVVSLYAANELNLASGSITSVSAEGKTLLFGATSNKTSWSFDYDGYTKTIASLPDKSISLKSNSVKVESANEDHAAAKIDIAGGGDLMAWEFTTGTGGSVDVLAEHGIFAVLPELTNGFMPGNSLSNLEDTLKPGDMVYLSGGNGLLSGNYVLLPAHYALLPGAYSVKAVSGHQDMVAQQNIINADGSMLVSGYKMQNAGLVRDARTSGFLVSSGAIARTQSEFTTTLASDFFDAAYRDANLTGYRLPDDAGRLSISAKKLELNGNMITNSSGSGRGAKVDISAEKIAIFGPNNSVVGNFDDYLTLSSTVLNNLRAESLLIGGVRSNSILVATSSFLALGKKSTRTLELTSYDGIFEGQFVSGAGIPEKTYVSSIDKQDDKTIVTLTNDFIEQSSGAISFFTSPPGFEYLDVKASNVELIGNAQLSGQEIILAATNKVSTASETTVSGVGTQSTQSVALIVGSGLPGSGDGALLRVSSGAQRELIRTSLAKSKGALDLLGSITTAKSVILDASYSSTLSGIVKMDLGGSLNVGARNISFGTPTNPDGLLFDTDRLSKLGDPSNLEFNSYSTLDFYGDVILGGPYLDRLSMRSAGLVGYDNNAKTVTLTAARVEFSNTNDATLPPLSAVGAGSLKVNAKEIISGSNTFKVAGFSQTTLNADQVMGEGIGGIDVAGNLNINAKRITSASLSSQTFKASDTLQTASQPAFPTNLEFLGNNPSGLAAALGGKLTLTANIINHAGNIEMPAGIVTVKATGAGDSLTLQDGSTISAKGNVQMLGKSAVTVGAGTVNLLTSNGNIIMEGLAEIDVSATGGAAAGSLVVRSAGSANLHGRLLGGAIAGSNVVNPIQGSFEYYASMLTSFSDLNTLLQSGGFNESRNIHVKQGNLTVANAVTAHNFSLTTDDGDISLTGSGQINASGAKGGIVNLNAGQKSSSSKGNITLASGTIINASATIAATEIAGSIGDGGKVILSASTDDNISPGAGSKITLAPDIVINISKGVDSNGNGLGSDGTLVLRAPRYGITSSNDSGTDVNLTASISKDNVKGNNANILIEGFKVYDTTGNLSIAIDSSYATALNSNNSSFLNNNEGIKLRLGTAADTRVLVIAGDEIRSAGDININEDIDLQSWEPGALTLRARGDINIKGSISAGFTGDVLSSGGNWTYKMIAGADLQSADIMTTSDNLNGNFTLDANKIIRTGTGDIKIATGGNFSLGSATSAIYTAGQIDDKDYSFMGEFSSDNTNFGINGGDISIATKGNIYGSSSFNLDGKDYQQMPGDWMLRQGSKAEGSGRGSVPYKNTTWAPSFSHFNQNIGALSGGNVNISSGGLIDDLSVVIATNGRLYGNNPQDDTHLVVNGGGDMTIKSIGNISGGIYMLDKGSASLLTAGAIVATSKDFFTAFALGDAKIDVSSYGTLSVMTIFDPMLTGMSGAIGGNFSSFLSYTPDSAVKLTSIASGINFNNSNFLTDFDTENQLLTDRMTNLLPGTVLVHAIGDDITMDRGISIAPFEKGNLEITSLNSIKFSSDAYVNMLDLSADKLPSVSSPFTKATLYRFDRFLNPYLSGQEAHAENSVYKNDHKAINIYAGIDLIGSNAMPITLSLPKKSNIIAGRDIINFGLAGQNLSNTDSSLIVAGNDIIYSEYKNLTNNTYIDNQSGISWGGNGNLQISAGRNIILGNSYGIVTRGNISNPFLPFGGANISLLTGANSADNTAFATQYINPNASLVYKNELGVFVKNIVGRESQDVWADFQLMDANLRQQFIEKSFFNELIQAGIEHNDVSSPNYGSYKRGFDAIKTYFPNASYDGRLDLVFSQIKTEQGGDVNILIPGGGVVIGLPKVPESLIIAKGGVNDVAKSLAASAGKLGIFTINGGNINIFAKKSIEVAQSREFTVAGGDILNWSSLGNIDAGKGSKTSTSAPPPLVRTDAKGNTIIDLFGVVSGSGIGTLQTIKNAPPGNVYLIAPSGTVDAGDAGVRSSGNLLVAAQAVANGANMQAAGTSSGVPAPSTANVSFNAPVSADSSNSAKQAEKATEAASKSASKSASALPSLITVEVLALGDDAASSSDQSNDDKKRVKKQ